MSEQRILGSDGLPARDSGAWAKEKLYYLEHYLDIFSVGMGKKWKGKLYYVDLFAGPGRCRIPETQEEFDGSPLIALKFNFAKYVFFESDPSCFKALETRIKNRAPEKLRNVELVPDDCNKKVSKVSPPPSPKSRRCLRRSNRYFSSTFSDHPKIDRKSKDRFNHQLPRRHGDPHESTSIHQHRRKCSDLLHGKRQMERVTEAAAKIIQ